MNPFENMKDLWNYNKKRYGKWFTFLIWFYIIFMVGFMICFDIYMRREYGVGLFGGGK